MGGDQLVPNFRYFMVTWGLATEFGGMTSMCLTRARTLLQIAGVRAPVLTFDLQPDYEKIVASLLEQGHLVEGMEVLNLYHYYRSADLNTRQTAKDVRLIGRLPVQDFQTQTIRDGGERIFCIITRSLDAKTVYRREFLRRDGSTFLLEEVDLNGVQDAEVSTSRLFSLLDTEGRVVEQYPDNQSLYRRWMEDLTGGEASVFVADSVQTTSFVADLEREHILKFMVIHSSHVADGGDPLRGKISTARRDLVQGSSHWDGLIFLTDVQRQDFIDRFGLANNLFRLTNPTPRAESLPDFDRRTPARGVMVCRLEPVKNVGAAIDVINIVRRSVPEVRLDIYGDGQLDRELQQKIDESGLGAQIRLYGYAKHAAEEFDTAAFSLLTSIKEGQPLALLESLGRGCPPVSYDIRYGPSDVISDGSNGYLVGAGDIEAMAARVIQLCRDRETALRLSRAAWDSAAGFSHQSVLEGLGKIVDTAWQQRGEKLRLNQPIYHQECLSIFAGGQVEITGRLSFHQLSGPPAEELLNVQLQVVPRKSGPPSTWPGEIESRGTGTMQIRLRAKAADIARSVSGDDVLDVFILVTGKNILHRQRISFGSGEEAYIPYATVNGQLSLKPKPKSG